MNTYTVGDDVILTAKFTDTAGDPVNPDTVRFTVVSPSGVSTDYDYGVDPEVANPDVGTYTCTISATEAGTWSWGVCSTGTNATAKNSAFRVNESVASCTP